MGHDEPAQRPARAGAAAKRARAARLRQEAENCVSIAVEGRNPGHVGDLIDEAVRLARRSRELGDAANER